MSASLPGNAEEYSNAFALENATGCRLCPRLCSANRAFGQRGICGADDTLKVARASLHFWEEPPISGTQGSGTVFFSYCSLGCVYCQNHAISRGLAGKAISTTRLAEIFLELQTQGAHNINLVTPTHYVPQIIEALDLARRGLAASADSGRGESEGRYEPEGRGEPEGRVDGFLSRLNLPIVYNTSGYELTATVQRLFGYVDVFLTDFKYASTELALAYSGAEDYFAVAMAALGEMVAQAGEFVVDSNGIASRGVIVRHLLLPGHLDDSKLVLERVFAEVGNQVCYSLMNQYTPMSGVPSELARAVTEAEYSELIEFALDLGVTDCFIQEGGTADESFIPPFDLYGV